jgi:hypothetical protein
VNIHLEFANLTAEQAHHIIEAYREAQCFGSVDIEALTVPLQSASTVANGADDGAPPSSHDDRGVPYNAVFHNPRFVADGSWAKRRNHDKVALAAFEAPYLTPKSPSDAPQAAPSTVAATANTAVERPDPNSKAQLDKQYPGISGVSAPTLTAAPVPTVEQYRDMWIELCRNFKVAGAHQAFVEKTFGGHPCADDIIADPVKRAAIWSLFTGWAAGVKL